MEDSARNNPAPQARVNIDELNRRARRRRTLDIAIRALLIGVLLTVLIAGAGVILMRRTDRQSTLSARAVANLTEAVRKKPDSAQARILLGDAFAADGQQKQAIEQYQAALKISKDNPGALAGLAQLAMVGEEWRTAEEYWKKIIDVLKKSQYAQQDLRLEKAYFYLGSTLMEVKEYEEAASAFKEALRIKRDASDTHFLLATAYKEMDLPAKYREELQTALKFDPLLPEANYEFGQLLLKEGDEAGAAEHFRLSADNAPAGRKEPFTALAKFGSADDRFERAVAAQKKGDLAEAAKQARIAVALDPYNIEAVRMAAQLFEKEGQTESARAAYDRLLTIDPNDADALAAMDRLNATKK